jgi:hypothetical protein
MLDLEPLLITNTIEFIIILDVVCVSAKVKKLNHQCPAGSVGVTRKNPHVTGAGSKQDLSVNCWCITWMVISTIQHYETYAHCVAIVQKKLFE